MPLEALPHEPLLILSEFSDHQKEVSLILQGLQLNLQRKSAPNTKPTQENTIDILIELL